MDYLHVLIFKLKLSTTTINFPGKKRNLLNPNSGNNIALIPIPANFKSFY